MTNKSNSKLTTQYTESSINDFIKKCNNISKTGFEILYTNSSYIRATNPSNLNDKAWWYSYDVRNYRCSNFLLLTGYRNSNYTGFIWNMIIDIKATKNSSSGQDVRDYLEIYNWTLDKSASKDTYTILKRNPDEPQFFVEKDKIDPSISTNCTFKFLNYNSGNYHFGYNPSDGITKMVAYFLNDLCGSDMVESDYTRYITYKFIYCHTGTIESNDFTSTISTYTNMCYVIPPKHINTYVHELESHILDMYEITTCETLPLYDNNENLNWECTTLVLSYIVSERLFTVFYHLDFDEKKIRYIETYKFNGYDMKQVFRVEMSKDFTVTYMNGITITEPGKNVTESEIELDITLKYKADGTNGIKYSFEYKDLWYNHVNEPEDSVEPNILCIILIK